jgi:hypothetical protein
MTTDTTSNNSLDEFKYHLEALKKRNEAIQEEVTLERNALNGYTVNSYAQQYNLGCRVYRDLVY